MKQFLKENLALVAGITLPLVLMVLFFAVGVVSRATVADPQYDMVYAVNSYDQPPYKVTVTDGKLSILYTPPPAVPGQDVANYPKPTLYLFDHKSLTSRPLTINYDNIVEGKVQDPELDKINQRKIIDTPLSPDGYSFRYDYDRGGLFTELFGFGSSRYHNTIYKNSRNIKIDNEYNYYNTRFIAWIGDAQP